MADSSPAEKGPQAEKVKVEVRRNDDDNQYEAYVGDELAGVAMFRREAGRLVFTHTEVEDAYDGRGVGGQLAAGALDDVQALGLKVTARCPFIKSYIDRHPAYADLVNQ